jgi:hypothetical protein
MTDPVLKSCPFCATDISIIPTLGSDEEKSGFHPYNDCLFSGCNIPLAKSAAWNTRSLKGDEEMVARAYHEGWTTGYRSGVTDGGSDSNWCDQSGDWEKSEARAAISVIGEGR